MTIDEAKKMLADDVYGNPLGMTPEKLIQFHTHSIREQNEYCRRQNCGCWIIWLGQGSAILPCKDHEPKILEIVYDESLKAVMG